MTHVVNVSLKQNPYPIYIGTGILEQFASVLAKHRSAGQIAVISSQNILDLWGKPFLSNFPDGQQVLVLTVPDGEQAKSQQQVWELYTRLLENRFERRSLIVALGGGVVGDLAGFVAATYLRGVDFIQVPTTLLAQVDSSIGGKTGINHPLGKNLIGAFKQPLFVFSDVAVLQTLPDAELRCGLGEVIKYGFILNRGLFSYLEENLDKALQRDLPVLQELVRISSQEKADVVAKDEKEQNLRMILNFGHTFGHALEAEFGFSGLKHGEAVILGMQCALYYNYLRGRMAPEEFDRGMALLKRVPVAFERSKLNPEKLVERMAVDKKVKNQQVRLILVDRIGSYRIAEADSRQALLEAFDILKE